MVSDWTDGGQEKWLAENKIALLRGSGKLAGPGAVEVDGTRHTARHIVLANGAAPFVPPVPGLRELDGVWGTREATSMKAVPRHLLVLGGGPAGVELAQVVNRLGGKATVIDGAPHLLAREPAPLGEALGKALAGEGIELVLGAKVTGARRDGEDYVLDLDDGRELRGDRILVATGRRPRVEGLGLETIGVEADPHGVKVDDHLRVADGRLGDRRRQRRLAAHPRRQVRGRGRRLEHPRRGPRRSTTTPSRGSPTPTRRRARWGRTRPSSAAPRGSPRSPRPPPTPTPTPTRPASSRCSPTASG